jgi:hypothetical protein
MVKTITYYKVQAGRTALDYYKLIDEHFKRNLIDRPHKERVDLAMRLAVRLALLAFELKGERVTLVLCRGTSTPIQVCGAMDLNCKGLPFRPFQVPGWKLQPTPNIGTLLVRE